MTPRLEVLWHRDVGDRLLVALEEEPAVPSGTRVELVQKCPQCHGEGFYEVIADPFVVGCVTCGGAARGPNGSGVISLGVATLEEVVPWGQPESYDAYACFAHIIYPSGPVLRIVHRPPSDGPNPRRHITYEPLRVDDLAPLSPKYVALCEVKK